jgi:hypothetical protein
MPSKIWSTEEHACLFVCIECNLERDLAWNNNLVSTMAAKGYVRSQGALTTKARPLDKIYNKQTSSESLLEVGSGCLELGDELNHAMEAARVL